MILILRKKILVLRKKMLKTSNFFLVSIVRIFFLLRILFLPRIVFLLRIFFLPRIVFLKISNNILIEILVLRKKMLVLRKLIA